MGSWNETCALSNMPIKPGDSIYVILITQNPYLEEHAGRAGCYPWDHWFQRSLPVLGTYDDYGRISIDAKESDLVETVLDQFRFDLVEFSQGPNEYHDLKASRTDLTWETLEALLGEGRAWIDKEAAHKASRNDSKLRAAHERALQAQAEQDAKLSDEQRKYVEESRQKYQDREDARDALFRSIYPGCTPGSSPVVRVYVRKDVYDIVMQHTMESFSSMRKTVTISQLRDEAGQYADAMLKDLSSSETDISVRRIMVGGQFHRDHVFASHMSSIGGIFLPYGNTPRSALEHCFKQYAHSNARGRKKIERSIHAAAARLAETILLTDFLVDHRMTWHPTTGTGSQAENVYESAKFHLDVARLSADIVLANLAERYANDGGEYDSDEWGAMQLTNDRADVRLLADVWHVSIEDAVGMIANVADKKFGVKLTKQQLSKITKKLKG